MFIEIFKTVLAALYLAFRSRAALLTKNAVLRQQIIVLQRSVPKAALSARPWGMFGPVGTDFADLLTILRASTELRIRIRHQPSWNSGRGRRCPGESPTVASPSVQPPGPHNRRARPDADGCE